MNLWQSMVMFSLLFKPVNLKNAFRVLYLLVNSEIHYELEKYF